MLLSKKVIYILNEIQHWIDYTLGQDYKLLDFTGGGIGKPPSTPR